MDPDRTLRVHAPRGGFFPIIGVAGVSFAVALIGQLIAWAILTLWSAREAGRREAPAPHRRGADRWPGPARVCAAALPGRA